jgi:valyl-tRNA synthetase
VHRAAWPGSAPLRAAAGDADPAMLGLVGQALAGVRRAKSEAKVSQRTEVRAATVHVPPAGLGLVEAAAGDLRAAGRVASLHLLPGGDEVLVADVELQPAP